MKALTRSFTQDAENTIIAGIKSCLDKYPSLRLGGSWSSGEAHLPPITGGRVYSFSDIDLVLIRDLSQFETNDIISQLQLSAQKSGVRLAGISVKKQLMAGASLHPAEFNFTKSVNPGRLAPICYLKFWTAISLIECTAREQRYRKEGWHCVASYSLSKFIFTLTRNVGFLGGQRFQSYTELSAWAKTRWRELPLREAYDVKVGSRAEFDDATAERLIGEGALRLILGNPSTTASIDIVSDMADQILRSIRGAAPLRPERYVQIAHEAAYANHLPAFVDYVAGKLI